MMPKGRISNTLVYPVKGFPGISTPGKGLLVDNQVGVVGDRTFAYYRKSQKIPTEWKPKGQFHVCMNTEGVAALNRPSEHALNDQFRLRGKKEIQERFNLSDCVPDTAILVDTQGKWNIPDSPKPYVSFLNINSVLALQEYCRKKRRQVMSVDPHRFRMNVWVDDMPAFAEIEYIKEYGQPDKYPMSVGSIDMGIDDQCERCRAIEQSPVSGNFDYDLLNVLSECIEDHGFETSPHRSKYSVMGWLAIPKKSGMIRIGDKVTFG